MSYYPDEKINNPTDFITSLLYNTGRNYITSSSINQNRENIPIDMINNEDSIDIYAEIPGVSKEHIDLDFYNDKLTISVEKKRSYEEPEVKQLKYGSFSRTITLTICITKKETVAVNYKNGVLHIHINKYIEEQNRFSVKTEDINE